MRGAYTVTACGSCRSTDLEMVLDMGVQPLAERYDEDLWCRLALLQCRDCTLVQLSVIVPQHLLFPSGHPYRTGNSAALRAHFADMAIELAYDLDLAPGDLIIDVGCNDGTLLAAFGPAYDRLGIDPTDQVKKCADLGIPRWQAFFTADLARQIRDQYGAARLVTACNVLAHVPDPHDFLEGVRTLLDPDDGVFVTENHALASITKGLQYDTVYHEHLRYYSPASLAWLLDLHGLDVQSVERVNTHGGSFRTTARRAEAGWPAGIAGAADGLEKLLAGLAGSTDGFIYGVSAATRATPLLHYARIAGYIEKVCEVAASQKIGQTMPGTDIPIVNEAELITDQPPYALLFCWHMAGDVVPKLRAAGYAGKFIVPLPVPKVIDG